MQIDGHILCNLLSPNMVTNVRQMSEGSRNSSIVKELDEFQSKV